MIRTTSFVAGAASSRTLSADDQLASPIAADVVCGGSCFVRCPKRNSGESMRRRRSGYVRAHGSGSAGAPVGRRRSRPTHAPPARHRARRRRAAHVRGSNPRDRPLGPRPLDRPDRRPARAPRSVRPAAPRIRPPPRGRPGSPVRASRTPRSTRPARSVRRRSRCPRSRRRRRTGCSTEWWWPASPATSSRISSTRFPRTSRRSVSARSTGTSCRPPVASSA